MKLSIGMMVKNEEKYLEKCLSSITPILDKVDSELIIVDTGSSDKTVEIAKKFTDKVYFHNWNNNFAEMRNITISYCSGEWFLCIDGDEIVEDCTEIINFFNSGEYKIYKSATFNMKNFTDLNNEKNYTVFPSLRLFEKNEEFKYIGAIHNQPVFKQPTIKMNVWLKHFGYVNTDKELMEKKFKRTSEILKEELKNSPDNIYYMFQLSTSYSMHGDMEEALEQIEQTYNYIVKNKICISEHIYVFQQLCLCYFNTHNYFELIKYASEWLAYSKKEIDAHYYLGYSYFMLSRNNEAIIYLEKYVEMIENNTYSIDTRITNYTFGKINDAYFYLSSLYKKTDNIEKALFYLKKIKNNGYNINKEIATLCINNKCYKNLYEYYNNLLEAEDKSNVNDLSLYIESEKLHLDKRDYNEINKLFAKGNTLYAELNSIRVKYENKSENLIECIYNFIKKEGITNLPDYYGDLIFYLIDLKENISEILSEITYKVLFNYFTYISAKYDNFSDKVYEYLKIFGDKEDFKSLRINKELFRYILLLNKLDNKIFYSAFLKYLDIGIKYINIIYSPYVLENENYQDCRNEEDGFFILMSAARQYENSDKMLYLQYLKKALNIYPIMKDGIKLILEEVNKVSNRQNNEMEEYKTQIKNTIQNLINNNKLEEANTIISEYEQIISDDAEIFSMHSVILILERKFDSARDILEKGLKFDNTNFDLNYNLGYVYDQLGEPTKSLVYYKLSKMYCNDNNMEKELSGIISKLTDEHADNITENKKKIVFFSKGDDSFIWDLINGLSDEFETKKVTVTEYKQIDEGMQWADICWFEWCDELIAYGSRHELAREKLIICRLHSYEAFTNYPSAVNWDTVDKIIFVAAHICDFAVKKFKINKDKTAVIPNCIDFLKYTFKDRKPGFNIAYVGYINYKKGPMLLLHSFKAIYDRDKRYKLYIAGKFQDDRDVLYFNQMIREFGIEKNVFYQGWQDNLDEWLEDKNYILCTSVLESQNVSVMQAMAKGIKPIIHNFVGAKNIFDCTYVWNSINECVEMVNSDLYNSNEYREFIKVNYALKPQLGKVKDLINS